MNQKDSLKAVRKVVDETDDRELAGLLRDILDVYSECDTDDEDEEESEDEDSD